MNFRVVLGKIHLYLSLLVGLFITILCITGSILVFEDDIKQLYHSNLFVNSSSSTGNVVTYEEAMNNAVSAYPEAKLQRIYTPNHSESENVYMFRFNDSGRIVNVYVDPGTGKVLGEYDDTTFLHWLSEIHYYLLMGTTGFKIVGYIGLIFLFIIVTGIYLWWPGIKSWVRGFKFRKSTNSYTKNYDYHRILAIYSLPFLIVIALTGWLLPFKGNLHQSPSKQQIVATPLPEGSLPIDELMSLAKDATPNGIIKIVVWPAGPENSIQFRITDPKFTGDENVRMWMDQYSGEVLYKLAPSTDKGFQISSWLMPLHLGTFNILTKVIYFIGGLIPPILMFTGVYMWLYKRKRQKRNKIKETPQSVNN